MASRLLAKIRHCSNLGWGASALLGVPAMSGGLVSKVRNIIIAGGFCLLVCLACLRGLLACVDCLLAWLALLACLACLAWHAWLAWFAWLAWLDLTWLDGPHRRHAEGRGRVYSGHRSAPSPLALDHLAVCPLSLKRVVLGSLSRVDGGCLPTF